MSLMADPIQPWQLATVTPATPVPKMMNSTTNAGGRCKFAKGHEQSGGGDAKLRAHADAMLKSGVAATVAWHYGNKTKSKTQ